jgi:hypothetical protein
MSKEGRITEQELLRVEDYLGTMLSPVQPRAEFVRDLGYGLGQAATMPDRKEKPGFLGKIFWVGAGFTSAILLLTLGLRLIINLVRGSSLRGRGRRKGIVPLP